MAVPADVAVEGAPRRRPPEPKKLTRAERWKRRGPLLPALIFAIILTQIPFVFTLFYSFQQWNLLRPESRQWVGLDNYGKVFTDPLFRNAVVNTVVLTVSTVLLSLVVGLAFALILDQKFLGRSVARTLLITPFLVMPTAAALVWKTSMYNPVFGLINWFLAPFGVGNVDWVSQFPMLSIIIVLTWQWTPFMMLIILAGLQSQSPEILEAARVDGASGWAIFRRITLPHLRQFLELSVTLGAIYHRGDFRRDLHDHPGRARPGHHEPAVLHLPAGVPGLLGGRGCGRRCDRCRRHHHHRDVRAASGLEPIRGGGRLRWRP